MSPFDAKAGWDIDKFPFERGTFMLTSKQRSYLRSLANGMDPIFQVGKGGIGDNLVKQFNDALEARELVKATVLKNAEAGAKEIAQELSDVTGSDLVQVIGSKFVLYKESKKNKVIILPH
jgi:RNA-binding protein